MRTLSKENAENVGLHLVMTGRLLDSDPELAYEHAQAAVRRAGRVDVVREAAGLAAYRTGRFAEALRELRTVRRLNGSSEHLAVMADCERGLGRPERALSLASTPEADGLTPAEAVELAIVVSGARLDLGEPEAAIAVLRAPAVLDATGVVAVRVAQALAAAYEVAGRADDARDVLAGYTQSQLDEASGAAEEDDDVVVFDLDEDEQVPDDDTDEARDESGRAPAVVTAARDAAVDRAGAPGVDERSPERSVVEGGAPESGAREEVSAPEDVSAEEVSAEVDVPEDDERDAVLAPDAGERAGDVDGEHNTDAGSARSGGDGARPDGADETDDADEREGDA